MVCLDKREKETGDGGLSYTVFDASTDWFNTSSSFIGNINPFRYRGYYQDEETGFYYLNSRYYDPHVKRFINADDPSYLGANGDLQSYNLYAYCSNNPIMLVDPNGCFANNDIFGATISYETILIKPNEYYFFVDMAYGRGISNRSNTPVNFLTIMPEEPWKVWDYSYGLDFYSEGRGIQVFTGTDMGFGWYDENGGGSISFDASGRLKFASTINDFENSSTYRIVQFEINTHNIFGTIVVGIFAPQVLGEIAKTVVALIFAL